MSTVNSCNARMLSYLSHIFPAQASQSRLKVLHAHFFHHKLTNEPMHEKTNNLCFRTGPTKTRLYSHSIKLEAWNFGYK